MSDSTIDIPAASMSTVRETLRHGMVQITDDVQGIARDLHDIDPSLHLYCDTDAEVWVVWQSSEQPDGSVTENLVTTMQGELDKRIVHRVRQITDGSYDLAREIEAAEAQADRDRDRERLESVGPVGERLAHAMRKDLGIKGKVFVP